MREGKEVRPLPVQDGAPINPHVMQSLNTIYDRLTQQNKTMEAMYQRLNPAAQFYDWVKETHPDILNQYTSIRELEEASKDYGVSLKMGTAQVMGVPAVDHEGKVVVQYGTL